MNLGDRMRTLKEVHKVRWSIPSGRIRPLRNDCRGGGSIERLIDLSTPAVVCYHGEFAEFERWSKLFSKPDGNVYLFKYVNGNMKRLSDKCASNIDNIFTIHARFSGFDDDLPKQITSYVRTSGDENAPHEVTMKKFLAAKTLNGKQQQRLIHACAWLESGVNQNLSYFIKDDKKISAFLNNLLDTPGALLYKRYKALNKISAKR